MHLSHEATQAIMLAAQGLLCSPRQAATKQDVLDTIRRMGALQIDTIHVVARSPYLVLWSRLGNYEPRWLDELLAEGALFEYWAHEASFLPIEDYPLYRHRMLDPASMGWRYTVAWLNEHREESNRVLNFIREHGPVRAADFPRTDGQPSGWWNWKPEKRALEALFTCGELMIARRENFQRIYDLRERVHPSWDDTMLPSPDQVRRTLVLKAVRALGITTARWVADYFRTSKKATSPLPAMLAAEGLLTPVQVEGWQEEAYLHPDHLPLAAQAAEGQLQPQLTTLLSPFDPLVWDRVRARQMFGFDYTIECYTPAHKRRYGYFTLPILWRGCLIGRLDAKAHRKEGRFEIKAIYLEPEISPNESLIADLAQALRDCAAWHNAANISIVRSEPKALATALQRVVELETSDVRHKPKRS